MGVASGECFLRDCGFNHHFHEGVPMTKPFHRAVRALALIAAVIASANGASAALIASEDFSYTDGTLAGASGGSGWASPWVATAGVTVDGGVAETSGLNSSRATRQFSASLTPSAGAKLYVSFDMAANPATATDFAGLSFFSGADERVFFGMTFNRDSHGITVRGGTTTAASAERIDTAMHFLLGEILFSGPTSFTVNLYVDQFGPLGTPDFSATGNSVNLGGIWDSVRVASGPVGATAAFDNILVGTELSDVMRAPEPGSLALVAIGIAALGWSRRKQ